MLSLDWIAGFFDGEGSIGIYERKGRDGRNPGFSMLVQVTQVQSPATLGVLQDFLRWGGSISTQSSSSGRGKYNWHLGGDPSAMFLQAIVDRLILKRPQAELAIRWQRERPQIQRDSRGRRLALTAEAISYNRSAVTQIAAMKKI